MPIPLRPSISADQGLVFNCARASPKPPAHGPDAVTLPDMEGRGDSVRAIRSAASCALAIGLVIALGSPATAAITSVNPVDGSWGGLKKSPTCTELRAPDLSEAALPPSDDECGSGRAATDFEVVGFTVQNRRITEFSFDAQIHCHASDTDYWAGSVMSYRTVEEFTYRGIDGRNEIPQNGLLRIKFQVRKSVDYPAGEVRASFDFRGPKAKVSIYYSGRSDESAGGTRFWNTCYSSFNQPTVVKAKRRAR